MPLIVKSGDLTQGHGYNPIPAVANIAAGSVFINNIPMVLTNDRFGVHYLGNSLHAVTAGPGSPDVFAENTPVWRKGDPTTCGDTANSPGGTVYANGN